MHHTLKSEHIFMHIALWWCWYCDKNYRTACVCGCVYMCVYQITVASCHHTNEKEKSATKLTNSIAYINWLIPTSLSYPINFLPSYKWGIMVLYACHSSRYHLTDNSFKIHRCLKCTKAEYLNYIYSYNLHKPHNHTSHNNIWLCSTYSDIVICST